MSQPTVTYCEPALDALGELRLHIRVVADDGEHGRVALCGATVGRDIDLPVSPNLTGVCEDCEHLLAP